MQFAAYLGLFPLADDANLLKRRARRRLIGAIALVVLIVVVLPVILDQQPRPVPQALTVQIPSQDGGPFKTRVLPPLQSPPVAPRKADSTQAAKDASNRTPQAEPESAARSRAAKKESPRAADKERAKPSVAEARRAQALLNDEGFVVPLGAFTNPDNAKQVQDRAASAGVKSYTENVKSQQGEQTRVRAGPFASRGAAEKARDKLKSLGLEVGQVAQR
jgi:DedD protein